MDDLLTRLKAQAEWYNDGHGALHKEAAAEIERLTTVMEGIAEFCSGDDRTLGAIARLAHIRNTADQALRRSSHQ